MLVFLNQMYTEWTIMDEQKRGIVCLPKTSRRSRPEYYRPPTLLNADIKLMARIIYKPIVTG